MPAPRPKRPRADTEAKRALILDAAAQIFAQDGLEGASLRAVAARAGYTPAALYFHFASKEALYAEVLMASLARLGAATTAGEAGETASARLNAAAMAFFTYYADHPRDLDLGFYLFRGGMKPAGLGRDHDEALNAALEDALAPISRAAIDLGVSDHDAKLLTVDLFAHATGLLLLLHTGRIRMFGASAPDMMARYIAEKTATLTTGHGPC
ncbi:HTH-type transcriptional regulator AcrR [Roseovarius gaetbuli]|uniref:HTH-type transcriptional regulator AcrR n=1 Tax=Roseovarius gaetbuli TaxID=1356575 RepID=A0A1X6Y305_9RHOB|nr:TetR/AcrR family transcriptional regulator [Roseovarius gaetbuli]SLN09717.1 HTH-type transcriptional regulator AcrR [Roseovarius gaetbuli]